MILDCQPYDKYIQCFSDIGLSNEEARAAVKKEFFIVPTKSGKHIVCKPFNKMTFQQLWNKSKNLKNIKMLDVHKDNPVILFVPDMK